MRVPFFVCNVAKDVTECSLKKQTMSEAER